MAKAKQKTLTRDEVAVGVQVVVNELPDAQVYTIKETNMPKGGVHLVYTLADGREAIDCRKTSASTAHSGHEQ